MADFLLIKAAGDGNLEQVKSLLRDGIDVNEENEFGYTALILAAFTGHFEIASLLIEYGALVNHQDNRGNAPLHYASTHSIASLLIEKGAEINIKNKYENTALMGASYNGYSSIVSLLLRNGADLFLLNKDGDTAPDIARKRNNSDCVSLLENYEHFHRYRKAWLSFATSLSSFQEDQNQELKLIQSQIQSPSLIKVMDSSDLVRYVTEFM